MRQIRLVRVETDPEHGTFGTLLIDGIAFCVTLEPYSRDNEKSVSCIPTGQYACERVNSPTYGNTFEVTNIQGRSDVLFHPGNIDENTMGCVLLGQYYGKLRGNRAVLNSGNTFKAFLKELSNDNVFKLTVVDIF
jgi:hypothetical protein